jgi:Fe(3+) dicitrate transport protein
LGKTAHNLVGARAYQATTIRKQNGTGTTGSDFDLSVNPDYTRNIKFKTENIAFFAENQFLTDNFSATPGVRFEHITSSGAGLFAKQWFKCKF